MRRLMSLGWIAAAFLAACGGQTITGSPTPSGSSAVVHTLTVSSNTASIASDGTTKATLTAVAKDASNNFVKGATVTFSPTAGGIAVTQATTDANGQAIATLDGTGVTVGTAITVTATASGISATTVVNVVAIQQTLSLTTSLPQIPSDGSKAATITATVRGSNNNLVSGVAVQFTSTSGNLAVTQATTDANGRATATLSASTQATQTITVTASAGSANATLPISVTGTVLSLVGPQSLTLTSPATAYTVSLTDSASAGIPNQVVALTATPASGLTFTPASVTTDAGGKATVMVTPTTAGNYVLSASAFGGANVGSQAITVSAQVFEVTPLPSANTKVNVVGSPSGATTQDLTLSWKDATGKAVTGTQVSFSTTRGAFTAIRGVPISGAVAGVSPTTVSGLTDGNGQLVVTIASTVAGPATITASATDPATQAVIQSGSSIDFVATVANAIAVQASPATIPTQGKSTITAVVRDAANNVVEGQTVNFKISTDVTKGTLSVASAVTDSQGRAQTVYTASSTPSASNGVVITASVNGTNVSQSTTLTVGGLTVFLSLGTGNVVGENATFTQFILPYSVQALDAGGNPVPNVPITLTIHPLQYAKGKYVLGATSWVQSGGGGSSSNVTAVTQCPNEDATSAYSQAQFNGVLDPGEDGCTNAGLDNVTGQPVVSPYSCNNLGNGNHKLDPGGTAVASPSSVTTSASGSADFSIIYPEDQALWVQVELIASATVSGTETTATATFVLPILAKYLTTTTSSPPGSPSPYGVATTCTNPN